MLDNINKPSMFNNSLLLVLMLFFMQNTLAANTTNIILVDKSTTKINLFKYMEILEDKSSKLTIDDVTQQKYNDSFKSTSIVGNSFGYTESSFWIRFSINSDVKLDSSLYLELEYPLIDYATLYIPNNNKEFTKRENGELIPASKREVNHRHHLFLIPKDSSQENTYYLRVESESSIQVPLNLLTSNAIIEDIDKSNLLLGLYYGNMIILMIVALISFLKIGDRVFLAYSFYLFSYLFFQLSLNGFFSQYISPLPLEYYNETTAISLGLVVFAGGLFSGTYLHIWELKQNKIKFIFYTLMASALLGVFIALFINLAIGIQISAITALLLAPAIAFGAIISIYNGYKPARYFLAAWSIFLFGAFITVLLYMGIIEHSFFTANAMQVGSTLELLLLSYALIDRVDILHAQKEQATLKATEYLNQINEGLESLVLERTKELNHKNKLLSNLAIRDSMTNMLNHNASIEELNAMKSTAIRHGYNLAVIMIDIDLFKPINDRYGHPAGDQVIIQVSEIIHKNIRPSDIAGRYGGEEFIIVLHDADETNAAELAERIRTCIESLQVSAIENQPVSASFGVSVLDPSNPYSDIIKQADEALYKAKNSGRNRVKKYSA